MRIRTVGTLALVLALSACGQSQSVGFTGIGAEGTGFGRGAVTGVSARAASIGPAPSAATLRAALAAPALETVDVFLGNEAVRIARVAVGSDVYAVLTGPNGSVSPDAREMFRLNARALTNCRQVGAFLTDPGRGSAAPLAC